MKHSKVLLQTDAEVIDGYEKARLEKIISDESERELASWHACWRKESLEHYLPLGWSFGIWDNNNLVGYFIAQPYLFFRGMTQTLWIERLVADNTALTSELIDLIYKLCRDKHLQKAVFYLQADSQLSNSVFQLNQVSDTLLELKTAKF